MKICITKETINILVGLANQGNTNAIERLTEYNSMNAREEDTYLVFTEKQND